MRPLLGVIADDLTGGMETAAMLAAYGIHCAFATRPDAVQYSEDAAAIVIAQKFRVATAAEAVRMACEAANALEGCGARQLYFKYCGTFDSTDEGNIGPVADALLEFTGESRTAYCPTSEELQRSVYNGHLFVGQQLVSESPKRFDPLTPMLDPNLVRVLQRQTPHPVGLLPHHQVRQGEKRMDEYVRQLSDAGVRHVIVDAIYREDLNAVAALTVGWRVMTGNAPLVQHLPPIWRARGWLDAAPKRKPLPAVEGPAVLLAGSCAERTLEQLAAFEQSRPVLRIDIAALEDVSEIAASAVDWARRHWDAGPVGVATSAAPDVVQAIQRKLGREGAAGLAEELLGRIASALCAAGARRFLVAGGETSGAVVDHLGIKRLTVGAYREPGIARAVGEAGGNMLAISLKSGKLGPVGMLLPVLDSMSQAED